MSTAYNCSQTDALGTEALQMLASSNVNLANYNRFFILFPTTSCNYDGLGQLGPQAPSDRIR